MEAKPESQNIQFTQYYLTEKNLQRITTMQNPMLKLFLLLMPNYSAQIKTKNSHG